ncbi:MAG: MATE family efflux transporter [Chitinophagales bacterium]|nr:MATE family efflux transporter [Chitinophagales bacterium]
MASSKTYNELQVAISNRQILEIALPISLAILVPQINFITNNIFLGHYSQHALATVSIAGVYYLIFAMIGFGLNNGLQTIIARRAGENRPDEIGKIFGQGVFISLAIAAAGIFITWFIAPVILERSIESKAIADDTILFLKIRIWGLPFLYIYQMRNALLVGTNNSRYLISGSIAETITNIAFDYVLIFGYFGFPEMGLNGAAISSIISEFAGMSVIFLVIHYKGITKRFSLFNHFKWDKERAGSILSLSLPLMFQLAISIVSWEFFYILIEHHGQLDLAVSSVMRNVYGLVGCITWAFAATSSAMVSNIIGQGQKDKVLFLIRKIVRISTGAAVFVALLINIFPQQLLSIFGQDEAFIIAGVPVVRVVSVGLVIMSFAVVWLNAVTGTGNSRMTFLIEFVSIIAYCIFVYFVLEKFFMPIIYGWMAELLYWIILFVLSFLYIRSGKWRNKVI